MAGQVAITVFHAVDENTAGSDEPSFELIAPSVLGLLGPAIVHYEAMTVASLPEAQARAVAPLIRQAGYHVSLDAGRDIQAFGRSFDPLDRETRRGPWRERPELSQPLDGLAWVQLAFPIHAETYAHLARCGVIVLGHMPKRTLYVATPSLEAVEQCGGLDGLIAVVEPVLSTDRASPSVLASDGPLEVTMAPGVGAFDLGDLPDGVSVTVPERLSGGVLARAHFSGAGAGARLLNDPRVVRIVPVGGVATPSDERQANILARRFEDEVTGEPVAPNYDPGPPEEYTGTYLSWLAARELREPENQQKIAVFDTGVAAGQLAAPPGATAMPEDLHPRVTHARNIVDVVASTGFNGANAEDSVTHGTSVIGTIIGAGLDAGRSGQDNPFAAGQGIAPDATVVSIKRWRVANCATDYSDETTERVLGRLFDGHNYGYSVGARIANHSWNFTADYTPPGAKEAIGAYEYEGLADDFEGFVRDSTLAPGLGPMTIVFSAGNQGAPASGESRIGRPANAKNVITVGAVDSHRAGFPDPFYQRCTGLTADDPVSGPWVVGSFSSRGPRFSKLPDVGPPTWPLAHEQRIKPDVVAPGWRVEGPRREVAVCGVDGPCDTQVTDSVTIVGPPVYAFARGTSWAAPAVSGALALKATQMLDGHPQAHPPWIQNGLTPSPTLLKAALIATARSLGPLNSQTQVVSCTGGDCRPSYHSGWGLVDLDRLTNREVGIFLRSELTNFTTVGQSWVSPWLKIATTEQEVLFALAWNDVPNPAALEALQRDLKLTLEIQNNTLWYEGNNFRENLVGIDDGYSQGFGFWDFAVDDEVNNVEAIFLPPGTLGTPSTKFFRVRVTSTTHALPPSTPYPTQSFSLYAWNAQCVSHDGSACTN